MLATSKGPLSRLERTGGLWDVVVVGGGNAGIVAAMTARERGARVLVLESAPEHLRGGNSRHTRNLRCVHDVADEHCQGAYTYEELWGDLCSVGHGPSDERLASFTVAASAGLPSWMARHGVRWQRPLRGTLQLGRTNRFFLGGGKALLNAYYRTADRRGVEVCYGARVRSVTCAGHRVTGLHVEDEGQVREIHAAAYVFAAGGFEANLDRLARYWGPGAHNYLVRGTPHNDGELLQCLLDAGAETAGEEKGFHSVAVDARSPRFDGGIATRIDAIPYGVVVDRHGHRFDDEGEDLWPKRYASWGGRLAGREGQIGYVIWDAKVQHLFLPPMYGAITCDTLAGVAAEFGLDAAGLVREIDRYNCSVVHGTFDPGALDDCHTDGLVPPKSHWAQPIDEPPFFGVPVRPGVTFTYRGVRVDERARVRRVDGTVLENGFAAGEIMSGNILSTGYLAGFGMTIGTVWGRVAGAEAAEESVVTRASR